MMTSAVELATLMEQGDREYQQDAVRAVRNDDGSWMIAVADGTGGGINTEEIAPAMVAALPNRISSDEEMERAFAAANLAARKLGTEESQAIMHEDPESGWNRNPDSTLAVAAWTPEGGLVGAWVGDSMIFIVPIEPGVGWHSPATKHISQ